MASAQLDIAPESQGEVHETTAHTQSGHREFSLLTFDPGVGIWAAITFGLLLIILRKFAWNPILNSIDEREKRLQDSMESAEDARRESRKIAEEQKRILFEAREESAKILNETRKTAEDIKARIEENAQEEKQKILYAAQKQIETLKNQAIVELKNVSADLAINAAEKLIKNRLDDDSSRELVKQCIEEFKP